MTTCEMCGSDSNSLTTIKVAGSTMNVCNSCRNMGNQVDGVGKGAHTFKRNVKSEIVEIIVSSYQSDIQKAMNKRGIDVHQLARAINIKESTLTNYIQGKIKPALTDAKKIQHFLTIKLIEIVESSAVDEDFMAEEKSSGSMSLGDLIKQQLDKK